MNMTTTEKILQDTVRDIRRLLADIGLLCDGCNGDIQEELDGARTELERADTAVSYALYLKKHAKQTGDL